MGLCLRLPTENMEETQDPTTSNKNETTNKPTHKRQTSIMCMPPIMPPPIEMSEDDILEIIRQANMSDDEYDSDSTGQLADEFNPDDHWAIVGTDSSEDEDEEEEELTDGWGAGRRGELSLEQETTVTRNATILLLRNIKASLRHLHSDIHRIQDSSGRNASTIASLIRIEQLENMISGYEDNGIIRRRLFQD